MVHAAATGIHTSHYHLARRGSRKAPCRAQNLSRFANPIPVPTVPSFLSLGGPVLSTSSYCPFSCCGMGHTAFRPGEENGLRLSPGLGSIQQNGAGLFLQYFCFAKGGAQGGLEAKTSRELTIYSFSYFLLIFLLFF